MATINQLLASESLQGIYQKSQALRRLNETVNALLADELKPHCQVANYQDGKLTIAVSNAAWATQIRYQSPYLIAKLIDVKEFHQLKEIHCYVIPACEPKKIPSTEPPKLSTKTQQMLNQTAEIVSDDRLRKALKALGD